MNLTRRDFIKGLCALTGATIASQFDRQLGTLSRALSGPEEWALSFDEAGLERLCQNRAIFGPCIKMDKLTAEIEISLDISESDLWALATLTDPDGSEWRTVDGETWTQGERKMVL